MHKTHLLNKIFGPLGFQIKRGDFFFRPSTREMKSLNKKRIVCIEIGTYKGKNAWNILKNLDIEKIYLIDPYKLYDDSTSQIGKDKKFLNVEKIAKKRLKKYKNIVWIKKMSEDAVKDVPMADFIYIDGNHEYEFVKKDIELYCPKLKKGGIIAGHDADRKSIFKAVSEFCVKNKLECGIKEKDWIIRR